MARPVEPRRTSIPRRAVHRTDVDDEILSRWAPRDSRRRLDLWRDPEGQSYRPMGRPVTESPDIDYWQGRLEPDLVEQAVAGLLSCLPQA